MSELESIKNYRLSLERKFKDHFRGTVLPELKSVLPAVIDNFKNLNIAIDFEEAHKGEQIEIRSAVPEARIVAAGKGVFTVYCVPPPRPLIDVSPSDFMP